MINFSKIAVIDNRLSGSTQLMENIIGDNVGMIPNLTPAKQQHLTDEVISLMRGVLNYQDPTSVADWYSAPTDTTMYGGAFINNLPASYNVYNLNPYVWFVHKKLGLTGYAFSVDDGISDVDSFNATKLLVTIGPITGSEWPEPAEPSQVRQFHALGSRDVPGETGDDHRPPHCQPERVWKLGQINAGASVASTGGDSNPTVRVQGVNSMRKLGRSEAAPGEAIHDDEYVYVLRSRNQWP